MATKKEKRHLELVPDAPKKKEERNEVVVATVFNVADKIYKAYEGDLKKEIDADNPNTYEMITALFFVAHRILAQKTGGALVDTINTLNSTVHNVDCIILAERLKKEFTNMSNAPKLELPS